MGGRHLLAAGLVVTFCLAAVLVEAEPEERSTRGSSTRNKYGLENSNRRHRIRSKDDRSRIGGYNLTSRLDNKLRKRKGFENFGNNRAGFWEAYAPTFDEKGNRQSSSGTSDGLEWRSMMQIKVDYSITDEEWGSRQCNGVLVAHDTVITSSNCINNIFNAGGTQLVWHFLPFYSTAPEKMKDLNVPWRVNRTVDNINRLYEDTTENDILWLSLPKPFIINWHALPRQPYLTIGDFAWDEELMPTKRFVVSFGVFKNDFEPTWGGTTRKVNVYELVQFNGKCPDHPEKKWAGVTCWKTRDQYNGLKPGIHETGAPVYVLMPGDLEPSVYGIMSRTEVIDGTTVFVVTNFAASQELYLDSYYRLNTVDNNA